MHNYSSQEIFPSIDDYDVSVSNLYKSIPIYKYSLPVWESPWTVVPLTQKEYNELSSDNKMKCFNIERQNSKVFRALGRPDITRVMFNTFPDEEVLKWEETEFPRQGIRYLRRNIKGKTLYYEEDYPYICFSGANIITRLFTSRNPHDFKITCDVSNYRMEAMSIDNVQNLYGVFKFDIDHRYESHAFVVWMDNKNVTIYNTYGGTVGIFIVTYDRENWIDLFANFTKYSAEFQHNNYHILFGFTQEMVVGVINSIMKKGPIDEIRISSGRIL